MNDEFKEKTIRKLIIENMFLLERIDKAIQYIENYYFYNSLDFDVKELLDILKGIDKE